MNTAAIIITKNKQYQKYRVANLQQDEKKGMKLVCFVRNLEQTALGTSLGGIIDTALLEDLWETLLTTFGATLEETLAATLEIIFGENVGAAFG